MRVQIVDHLLAANNRLVRRVDGDAPNPRPVDGEPWYPAVRAAHPRIRAEWDAFVTSGYQLPLIEDLLNGPQGNEEGWWRAGPLISRRRAQPPFADYFPSTVAALLQVPGLLSALVSVLGPGAELRTHTGPNAGALNFLLAVSCPTGSGHRIEDQEVDLDPGELVVFDDTLPHAAWNRSDRPRVLVIGDVLRPLPTPAAWVNRGAQWAGHHLSPGYARATARAVELDRSLNR